MHDMVRPQNELPVAQVSVLITMKVQRFLMQFSDEDKERKVI